MIVLSIESMTEAIFKNKTPSEKKAMVLAEGTEVRFLVCPMCGMSKSLNKYLSGQYAFTNINFNRMHIIQVRRGGGKGSGFYKDESRSLLLDDVKNDPQYADIFEQIKRQCRRILKELE